MEDAWEAKAYDEYVKKHGNTESNLLAREQAMRDEFNGERMAEHLERCLTTEETVHHEDEDRANDIFENLRLFLSNAEHISYHRRKEIELRGRRPTNALGQYLKGGYNHVTN